MTINVVKAWHHLLKTHIGGKRVIKIFSFSGVISHILTIGDQWKQRALDIKELWFKA